MRILHVIDSLRPRRGGPAVVAASLAAAQAALGHEVSLVSYAHADAPGAADPEPLAAQIPCWSGVRHIRLGQPSAFERLLARRLRRKVRAIAPRLDVAHLHRIWEPLIPAAAAEARGANVPYVISPHGMLHPWSLAQNALKKKLAMKLVYGRALRGAAAIHALNAEEKANLEALNLNRPIMVVPNGVWLDEGPDPAPDVFRRSLPEIGAAPFVLFLGRLHHKKGPDVLVEAFKEVHRRLPQVRLVIAGDDSGARADTQQRIEAAGLAGHVLLVGPIYGQRKRAALKEAACFCLPSRQEGFPVAVLEALAERTPAVISEQCHMPEVASERAGYVVRLESEAIADAIGRLLEDEDLRRRMGQNARKLVERQYTWPRIAQQMLDAYASLHGR